MKAFPRLYSLAEEQDTKVGDYWNRNSMGERWRFVGVGSCLCGKQISFKR
jgi:hypothetical protein